jgi:hypothetical protein
MHSGGPGAGHAVSVFMLAVITIVALATIGELVSGVYLGVADALQQISLRSPK